MAASLPGFSHVKGFTLVELLVVISIIVLSVNPPGSTASTIRQSISSQLSDHRRMDRVGEIPLHPGPTCHGS